ncbi:hypothetical protein E2C01_047928 [Portunus trituberculatus]|uniref:Uncharacterized protein n=1 Tax=Portunus trituberculatus TaxID=210409 RepID=A0A5B7G9U2_PORTR|nr:hypothetical protein [Portunus trituberculatus]
MMEWRAHAGLRSYFLSQLAKRGCRVCLRNLRRCEVQETELGRHVVVRDWSVLATRGARAICVQGKAAVINRRPAVQLYVQQPVMSIADVYT